MLRFVCIVLAGVVLAASLMTGTSAQVTLPYLTRSNMAGGGEGRVREARCAPGEYLTGLTATHGSSGAYIQQVAVLCSRWDGSKLVRGTERSGAIGADNGHMLRFRRCPSAQSRAAIHALSVRLSQWGPPFAVRHLDVYCRQDGVSHHAGPLGSVKSYLWGEPVEVACRPDEAGVGVYGAREYHSINSIGLLCAPSPGLRVLDPRTRVQGEDERPENTEQKRGPGETPIDGRHKTPLPRGTAPKS